MRLNTKLLALFTCFIFLVMFVGLYAGDVKKDETAKPCSEKTAAEKAECAKTCTGTHTNEADAKAAGCQHGVTSTGAAATAEKDGEVKVQQASGEVKTAAKHECTAEQQAACAKSKNTPGCCSSKTKTTEAAVTTTSDAHAKEACVSKTDPKCASPEVEVKVGGEEKAESK